MQIENPTVLVTGANRGIGRAFVQELLQRGARRVYATARHPESIDHPSVITLPLDITDPEQVADVA